MERGKLARTAWAFSAYPEEAPEAVASIQTNQPTNQPTNQTNKQTKISKNKPSNLNVLRNLGLINSV